MLSFTFSLSFSIIFSSLLSLLLISLLLSMFSPPLSSYPAEIIDFYNKDYTDNGFDENIDILLLCIGYKPMFLKNLKSYNKRRVPGVFCSFCLKVYNYDFVRSHIKEVEHELKIPLYKLLKLNDVYYIKLVFSFFKQILCICFMK